MDNNFKYYIYLSSHKSSIPSCEDQERWILQMADFQEINIVGVFIERSPGIKQWNLLLTAINKNEANGIIVWDISLLPTTPFVKRLISMNKIHAVKPFLDS